MRRRAGWRAGVEWGETHLAVRGADVDVRLVLALDTLDHVAHGLVGERAVEADAVVAEAGHEFAEDGPAGCRGARARGGGGVGRARKTRIARVHFFSSTGVAAPLSFFGSCGVTIAASDARFRDGLTGVIGAVTFRDMVLSISNVEERDTGARGAPGKCGKMMRGLLQGPNENTRRAGGKKIRGRAGVKGGSFFWRAKHEVSTSSLLVKNKRGFGRAQDTKKGGGT